MSQYRERLKKSLLVCLFALMPTAMAAESDVETQINVESNPDVVVESLSLLMPVTTKEALGKLPLGVLKKMGIEQLLDEQNEFSIKYDNPYSPYTSKDHPLHQSTVLYKMDNLEGSKSILPLMKNIGFERVLFAANKLFWYVCLFFVTLAVGRMAWVSMTVEEGTKSTQKLIALAPVLALSLVLVKPDEAGYNYAQLILVMAFLISNYLASFISLFGSVELYKHVINSYYGTDYTETARETVSARMPNLFDSMASQAFSKLVAENTLSNSVGKMLEGEKLTNTNLLKAIETYNKEKELKGEYKLTPVCFSANWNYELANNKSCSALIADSQLSIKDLVFFYPPKSKITGFEDDYSILAPLFTEILEELYLVHKKNFCASLAKNRFAYSKTNFDRSLVCKVRDSGGGFDLPDRYYGAAIGSDGRLTHIPSTFEKDAIAKKLYDTYSLIFKDSVDNMSYEEMDTTIKNNGFFITPLAAVYSAISVIRNQKATLSDVGLESAAVKSDLLIQDLLPRLQSTTVSLRQKAEMAKSSTVPGNLLFGELSNYDFGEIAGGASVDSLGFWKMLRGTFWSNDSDLNGEDHHTQVVIKMFESNHVKTVEPYSKLQEMYEFLLPISVGALMGGNVLSDSDGDAKRISTARFTAGKVLSSMGTIMFFTAMACKIVSGLLFLSLAIALLIRSFKRLIIFLITAPIITIKYLKDGFSEVNDDDDNLVVSKYLINAVIRIFIDLPMLFIAILCSYVIGTFSANLVTYVFLLFGTTTMNVTSLSPANLLTGVLFSVGMIVAIIWGLYQGVKLMEYVHQKGTDFVDDATGVDGDKTNDELFQFIKSSMMPTRFIN